MFAPSLEMGGQNICVIPLGTARPDAKDRISAVRLLLESAGARLTDLTSVDHDRVTSILQAATHASLLALAEVLRQSEVDHDTILRLATPFNQTMFAMIARMTAANAGLYQEIQVNNPYAREARHTLAKAIQTLDESMTNPSPNAMKEIFESCRRALGVQAEALTTSAAAILREIAQRNRSSSIGNTPQR
jgi:prephenate dehydrogenase